MFIEAEIISGEPELSVHEKMRWVSPGELTAFEWCPADRPVAEEISKSKENILADLIKEELVTEFRLRCKKVHPAVETMIDKASKAAHNEGEYYGYNDVFISEEEK